MQSLQMQLLHLLQEDCRLPLEKLAVMTGSTVETVATVIDDMERNGIILRYAPVINWDKTDRERVEAMIEVRVTPQRDQGFDAIAERIYRFDEVKSVYLMSGAYDLLLLVEAHTLKELAFFVSTKLSTLETVTGTATPNRRPLVAPCRKALNSSSGVVASSASKSMLTRLRQMPSAMPPRKARAIGRVAEKPKEVSNTEDATYLTIRPR